MIITNYGKQFFKVQLGDTVIALNPISKESKSKVSRFGADVALVSLDLPDFNGVDSVAYGGKEPFIISGPGEYEIKGIFIKGFATGTPFVDSNKINTIYIIFIDGVKLCFLGSLRDTKLDEDTLEALQNVDILLTPIDDGNLSPSDAYKFATKLGAKIVIPMGYEKKSFAQFLEESGAEEVSPIDKLTIKKKDLEGKSGELIALKSTT